MYFGCVLGMKLFTCNESTHAYYVRKTLSWDQTVFCENKFLLGTETLKDNSEIFVDFAINVTCSNPIYRWFLFTCMNYRHWRSWQRSLRYEGKEGGKKHPQKQWQFWAPVNNSAHDSVLKVEQMDYIHLMTAYVRSSFDLSSGLEACNRHTVVLITWSEWRHFQYKSVCGTLTHLPL